jgi:acetoacetyl-CoA synthetase
VAEPAAFWRAAWDFCGMVGEPGEVAVATDDRFWKWRFFPEARLNVAENLLRLDGPTPAIIFRGEDGETAELTWSELRALVSRLQQALAAIGVQPGDRVAAWLPNRPETYALMIAAASIGAVFSSCSPDFGVDGVVDRFGQIEPVVLVAAPSYAYGGKRHDCLARLDEIRAALPSVRRTVVLGADWDEWLAPYGAEPVRFTPLAFDHPWYVLYSSGTTGKPKCIVHRAGGVLLKHLVEHQLHSDNYHGDRVFYFTTAGWMMWNWLASGLASGATIVLYDGSPFEPDGNRLFDLVDELGVTFLGISAKFLDAIAKAGVSPRHSHSLASLRTIASTGSPLLADGFRYVYEQVKPDVHLASISGGTDLCGCLVAGDPTSPVWAGEIQRPGLAMDIDVVDELGESVSAGEQGELICRTPFPSMPLGFWGDDVDDTRYRAAYFDRFPGVWHHGDFCSVTEHGGYVITGRSDATLNPGGVRIGTAEIYRVVDARADVLESIVIGQEWEGDTRIVLFVRMAADAALTDAVRAELKAEIRTQLSPRHVPAVIVAVSDLPRTRSGKLTELAVREVVHGRAVKNTEALANPEALDLFADLPELSG